MITEKKIIKLSSLLLAFIPIALLTGPFLPDLLLSIISIVFLYFSIKYQEWQYYKNKFFIVFMIFYLYLVIRSIFSEFPILSFESSFFYFRFGVFALAIWYLIENNENTIKIFAKSLLFSFAICLLSGCIQLIFDYNLIGYSNDQSHRLNLPFSDKLIFGNYLVRLFPLLLAVFIFKYNSKKINFFLIIFILISTDVLIFISGERTALSLFLFSSIFILIFIQKYKKLRFYTLVISILLMISISIFSSSVRDRNISNTIHQMGLEENGKIVSTFSEKHDSLFFTGINIFKDNKLFGIGPKMFRKACDRSEYSFNEYSCSTHPHNNYIQILSETGLIGMSFVMLLNIYIFLKLLNFIFKLIKYKKRILSDYQICLITCFVMSLFPLLPTLSFFNNWINIIYFLPVGFYLHSIYNLNVNNNR